MLFSSLVQIPKITERVEAPRDLFRLSPAVVLYILLYIYPLQTPIKDSLLYISFLSNSVLYISFSIHQKSVLETYFAPDFCTYVFIIPLNIMYIFYFNLIYYIKYKNR